MESNTCLYRTVFMSIKSTLLKLDFFFFFKIAHKQGWTGIFKIILCAKCSLTAEIPFNLVVAGCSLPEHG